MASRAGRPGAAHAGQSYSLKKEARQHARDLEREMKGGGGDKEKLRWVDSAISNEQILSPKYRGWMCVDWYSPSKRRRESAGNRGVFDCSTALEAVDLARVMAEQNDVDFSPTFAALLEADWKVNQHLTFDAGVQHGAGLANLPTGKSKFFSSPDADIQVERSQHKMEARRLTTTASPPTSDTTMNLIGKLEAEAEQNSVWPERLGPFCVAFLEHCRFAAGDGAESVFTDENKAFKAAQKLNILVDTIVESEMIVVGWGSANGLTSKDVLALEARARAAWLEAALEVVSGGDIKMLRKMRGSPDVKCPSSARELGLRLLNIIKCTAKRVLESNGHLQAMEIAAPAEFTMQTAVGEDTKSVLGTWIGANEDKIWHAEVSDIESKIEGLVNDLREADKVLEDARKQGTDEPHEIVMHQRILAYGEELEKELHRAKISPSDREDMLREDELSGSIETVEDMSEILTRGLSPWRWLMWRFDRIDFFTSRPKEDTELLLVEACGRLPQQIAAARDKDEYDAVRARLGLSAGGVFESAGGPSGWQGSEDAKDALEKQLVWLRTLVASALRKAPNKRRRQKIKRILKEHLTGFEWSDEESCAFWLGCTASTAWEEGAASSAAYLEIAQDICNLEAMATTSCKAGDRMEFVTSRGHVVNTKSRAVGPALYMLHTLTYGRLTRGNFELLLTRIEPALSGMQGGKSMFAYEGTRKGKGFVFGASDAERKNMHEVFNACVKEAFDKDEWVDFDNIRVPEKLLQLVNDSITLNDQMDKIFAFGDGLSKFLWNKGSLRAECPQLTQGQERGMLQNKLKARQLLIDNGEQTQSDDGTSDEEDNVQRPHQLSKLAADVGGTAEKTVEPAAKDEEAAPPPKPKAPTLGIENSEEAAPPAIAGHEDGPGKAGSNGAAAAGTDDVPTEKAAADPALHVAALTNAMAEERLRELTGRHVGTSEKELMVVAMRLGAEQDEVGDAMICDDPKDAMLRLIVHRQSRAAIIDLERQQAAAASPTKGPAVLAPTEHDIVLAVHVDGANASGGPPGIVLPSAFSCFTDGRIVDLTNKHGADTVKINAQLAAEWQALSNHTKSKFDNMARQRRAGIRDLALKCAAATCDKVSGVTPAGRRSEFCSSFCAGRFLVSNRHPTLVCKVPGCATNVHVDPTTKEAFVFCNRTHGRLFASFEAYMNGMGSARRVQAAAAFKATVCDENFCGLAGCMEVLQSVTVGATTSTPEFCTREHMLLEGLRINATSSKEAAEVAVPSKETAAVTEPPSKPDPAFDGQAVQAAIALASAGAASSAAKTSPAGASKTLGTTEMWKKKREAKWAKHAIDLKATVQKMTKVISEELGYTMESAICMARYICQQIDSNEQMDILAKPKAAYSRRRLQEKCYDFLNINSNLKLGLTLEQAQRAARRDRAADLEVAGLTKGNGEVRDLSSDDDGPAKASERAKKLTVAATSKATGSKAGASPPKRAKATAGKGTASKQSPGSDKKQASLEQHGFSSSVAAIFGNRSPLPPKKNGGTAATGSGAGAVAVGGLPARQEGRRESFDLHQLGSTNWAVPKKAKGPDGQARAAPDCGGMQHHVGGGTEQGKPAEENKYKLLLERMAEHTAAAQTRMDEEREEWRVKELHRAKEREAADAKATADRRRAEAEYSSMMSRFQDSQMRNMSMQAEKHSAELKQAAQLEAARGEKRKCGGEAAAAPDEKTARLHESLQRELESLKNTHERYKASLKPNSVQALMQVETVSEAQRVELNMRHGDFGGKLVVAAREHWANLKAGLESEPHEMTAAEKFARSVVEWQATKDHDARETRGVDVRESGPLPTTTLPLRAFQARLRELRRARGRGGQEATEENMIVRVVIVAMAYGWANYGVKPTLNSNTEKSLGAVCHAVQTRLRQQRVTEAMMLEVLEAALIEFDRTVATEGDKLNLYDVEHANVLGGLLADGSATMLLSPSLEGGAGGSELAVMAMLMHNSSTMSSGGDTLLDGCSTQVEKFIHATPTQASAYAAAQSRPGRHEAYDIVSTAAKTGKDEDVLAAQAATSGAEDATVRIAHHHLMKTSMANKHSSLNEVCIFHNLVLQKAIRVLKKLKIEIRDETVAALTWCQFGQCPIQNFVPSGLLPVAMQGSKGLCKNPLDLSADMLRNAYKYLARAISKMGWDCLQPAKQFEELLELLEGMHEKFRAAHIRTGENMVMVQFKKLMLSLYTEWGELLHTYTVREARLGRDWPTIQLAAQLVGTVDEPTFVQVSFNLLKKLEEMQVANQFPLLAAATGSTRQPAKGGTPKSGGIIPDKAESAEPAAEETDGGADKPTKQPKGVLQTAGGKNITRIQMWGWIKGCLASQKKQAVPKCDECTCYFDWAKWLVGGCSDPYCPGPHAGGSTNTCAAHNTKALAENRTRMDELAKKHADAGGDFAVPKGTRLPSTKGQIKAKTKFGGVNHKKGGAGATAPATKSKSLKKKK